MGNSEKSGETQRSLRSGKTQRSLSRLRELERSLRSVKTQRSPARLGESEKENLDANINAAFYLANRLLCTISANIVSIRHSGNSMSARLGFNGQ